MELINLSLSKKVKIIILTFFIFPLSLEAQVLEFDLIQGENKIENFKILSFKNNSRQVYISKSGKIEIDKNVILQADSIFISHSFYKNVFDLQRIKEKSYYIEEAMELEGIVLKTPEIYISEAKGKKVDGLCNTCRQSISIPTEDLQNKTIKGIELYFPKGKYHSKMGGRRVQSKNKEIEIFISFTNQKDTIYPDQSLNSIKETLQVKKNGWNYYDLRQYDLDVADAERIFISIQALDDMVLGRRKIRKEDRENVIIYLSRDKRNWESIYFIDSRLFAPELDRISLAYRIHYYE